MGPRLLTALVLAAALVVVLGSSRSATGPPATAVPGTPPALGPLLGIADERLVRVDPDTLRPLAGRGVDVGSEGCAPRSGGQACWSVPPWTYSPERSRVALARHEAGVVRSLRVVDVPRMRVVADVPVEGGAVGLIAWPARDRLLAVQEICCEEDQQLLVADVPRRRVVARRPLGGTVVRAAHTPREIVLLVAPPRRVGPPRLAVVDLRGGVRSVRLDGVQAGEEALDHETYRMRRRLPGLAVDPAERRAFVADRGVVAAVDLVTLTVAYHEPVRSRSLLARLRDWLEPPAYAKSLSGSIRTARWLGEGLLAVAGERPAGLSLVDTRDWSEDPIDPGATDFRVAGDLLLATSPAGLRAYGLDGERRFARFDEEVWIDQVHDARAYVYERDALKAVDLATGTVEHAERPPWLLVDAASGWWTA